LAPALPLQKCAQARALSPFFSFIFFDDDDQQRATILMTTDDDDDRL